MLVLLHTAASGAAAPQNASVGEFVVSWDGSRLAAFGPRGAAVWATAPGGFLQYQTGEFRVGEDEGMFTLHDDVKCSTESLRVDSIVPQPAVALVVGSLSFGRSRGCGADVPFSLAFGTVPESTAQLAISVQVRPDGSDGVAEGARTVLLTASPAHERVYGFGVQYSADDMKGRVVPILSSEQGIGRGLKPITAILPNSTLE